MARVLGHSAADRWEQEVLKSFKHQCPDDWVVMPSVRWTLDKNGYVRDGESDFVVLVPNSGLVVVEVKGSREFKVDNEGIWHRFEGDMWIPLKESPPTQATRNMHDLVGTLQSRFSWSSFPGRFAYLVVYPQGEARELPAMFDESTLATRRHMNQLATRVRNALDRRAPESIGGQFTASVLEDIADHLANRRFFVHKVDTGQDANDDATRIEQLTRQQFAALRGLFQMPRVAVVGPAGSGKTILALWRLQALVQEGARALYVCYNKALAAALRLRSPELAHSIKHVDGLFMEICRNMPVKGDTTTFFREMLPGAVIDRAPAVDKYDVIIVDEGQDFSEEQLIALMDLLAEKDGFWALFADWRQDIFRVGQGKPIGCEVVFHLHYNCRNTVNINEATNRYLSHNIESMPGMPNGLAPTVEVCRNTTAMTQRAWELARQWSGDGSVVILSPFTRQNSGMLGSQAGYGLRLGDEISDFGAAGTVYFSTIKSFKGIEAASVIVIDLDIPGVQKALDLEDLYVACTRATARLALLTSRREAADFYLKCVGNS
jgi:superfamily I DNA/RNA helicase